MEGWGVWYHPALRVEAGEMAELAEGARLLSEYRAIKPYLGFESPSLRQRDSLPAFRAGFFLGAGRARAGRARVR